MPLLQEEKSCLHALLQHFLYPLYPSIYVADNIQVRDCVHGDAGGIARGRRLTTLGLMSSEEQKRRYHHHQHHRCRIS